MTRIPAELTAAMRREGEAAYPDECCGILLGRLPDDPDTGQSAAQSILPIVNAREAEERRHRFRIEPEDLMRAEKRAREQGLDVLGFYHSHPDHPARPSDYDRQYALPFYSYLIIAVERGRAGELTSWKLAPDRSAFLREDIIDV
jgi:proteasome lid subunit RPN8/RPN11